MPSWIAWTSMPCCSASTGRPHRVDWNQLLLEHVDLDAVLDRIDVDRLVQRVDVNDLVERSNLKRLVVRSTTGIFTHVLDALRAQAIRADQVVHSQLGRCLTLRMCWYRHGCGPRRPPPVNRLPPKAGQLRAWGRPSCCPRPHPIDDPPCPRSTAALALAAQGRCAGMVSRCLAWWIDQAVVLAVFALGVVLWQALTSGLVHYVETHHDWRQAVAPWLSFNATANSTSLTSSWLFPLQAWESQQQHGTTTTTATPSTSSSSATSADTSTWELVGGAVVLYVWNIVYTFVGLALVGRTPGKALLGLWVTAGRRPLSWWQALIRAWLTSLVALVVLLASIGWLRRDRRQWHDLLIGSTVLYAWEDANLQDRLKEQQKYQQETMDPFFVQLGMDDDDDTYASADRSSDDHPEDNRARRSVVGGAPQEGFEVLLEPADEDSSWHSIPNYTSYGSTSTNTATRRHR